MPISSNSIETLHKLLQTARQQDGNARTRNAWAKAFMINADDTDQLMSLILEVFGLIDRAIGELKSLGATDNIYVTPLTNVRTLLRKQNLDAKWSQWAAVLDDLTMAGLEYSANLLAREGKNFIIDQGRLEEVYGKLRDLRSEMESAALPDELKAVLLQKLDEMLNAIRLCNILGPEPLRQALENSLGALFTNAPSIAEVKNEDAMSKIREMVTLASEVAQILSLPIAAAALVASFLPLLVAGG